MLTIRKQKFIQLVARTNNITQSYITAGYSPKSALNNAHSLYNNPEINALIAIEIDKYINLTEDQWRKQLIQLKEDPNAKVSDKIRIMELYGKHKKYIGADNVNITTVYQDYGNKRSDILSKRLRHIDQPNGKQITNDGIDITPDVNDNK